MQILNGNILELIRIILLVVDNLLVLFTCPRDKELYPNLIILVFKYLDKVLSRLKPIFFICNAKFYLYMLKMQYKKYLQIV